MVTFLISAPFGLNAAQVSSLITTVASGITLTSVTNQSDSVVVVASRALTTAEQAALNSAIVASLLTFTSL